MKYAHIGLFLFLLLSISYSCNFSNDTTNIDLSSLSQRNYLDKISLDKEDLELTGNVKSVIYFSQNNDEEHAFQNEWKKSELSDIPVIRRLQNEIGRDILYNYLEFNTKGKVIREIEKSKTEYTEREFEYNFKHQLVKIETSNSDNKFADKNSFTYDQSNRLTKIVENDSYSKGQFITLISFTEDSTIFTSHVIEKRIDTVHTNRYSIHTDSASKQSIKSLHKQIPIDTMKFQYEYDKNENWIVKSLIKKENKPKLLSKRKIEYFN